MMNYNLFKEVVKEQMPSYFMGDLMGREVNIQPVEKINQTLDGLTLVLDGENKTVSPAIYVNDMYERYKETGDLKATLEHAADTIHKAMVRGIQVQESLDFNNSERNIVFQLINTEQNKSLLDGIPHREWKDLSIIYRLITSISKEAIESTIVNNDLTEYLGFNEEQLFKLASENTPNIFSPTVRSMNEVVRDMFVSDGLPLEIVDLMMAEIPSDRGMYVISNDRGINGAISMLYEEVLHTLAEKLGSDLYILPSSLHETIAIPAALSDPEELAQMVSEVNMNEVRLEDRLSNQIYHYDKELRVLSKATDTPNKRLDGMVAAEMPLIYETKRMGR